MTLVLGRGDRIINPFRNSWAMQKKRYESRLFTIGLFVLIGAGLTATALDPFGIAANKGNVVRFESITGINLTLFFVGFALVTLGMIIRFVAIATLRGNFSGRLRIREGHTLVKHGIYQWIRHPAYLGAMLLFLGIPVMLSSPLGFLVMLLLVPYLVHRIKLEEKMLTERFGPEYEEYIKKSKKLIPFLF
jgi:protein-S-isoprenylcysteine O-methyltransferase Ste14